VEGEACPVCGSLHHPNAHKAVAEHLINTVYQEFLNAKKHLELLTKDLITKETELKELQKRIAQQTTQNAEYATLYTQEYERLTQSVYYYMAYPTAEIELYITSKISEIEHLLAETETLFEVLNQLKSLTDELNTLTKDTQYMINRRSMLKMKDGVILVNTGRGQLIDSADLVEALKDKKVGAVALDVYEEEEDYFFEDKSTQVIEDDILGRLLSFYNVLITSHQAYFTKEAVEAITVTTLNNIKDFIEGKPLVNEVPQN